MTFKDSKSLKEFDDDNLYNALCKGLSHPDDISHLKDLFKDAEGKILRKILTKDASQVLSASQRLLVKHLSTESCLRHLETNLN
jgi:hypothetical protein